MLKSYLAVIALLPILRATAQNAPADYVNPFIGASTSQSTAGDIGGLGKTFPGAATPFGMTQVSPNTITGGDNGSGYSYEHKTIEGFALTQMSGVGWYGDLGNFLVMPSLGQLYTYAGKEGKPGGYRLAYDKKTETASAGYYSVILDGGIRAELTATPHCGMMRFTFPQNKRSRIQIDLARRVGGTSTLQRVEVVNDSTIEGWMKCTPDGGGWGNGGGHADYTVYFCARFSKPLRHVGVWRAHIPDGWSRKLEDVTSERYQDTVAHAEVLPDVRKMEDKHLGFYTGFATKAGESVTVKVGISFVNSEGARLNLASEIPDDDFDRVRAEARRLWNEALSKVRVEGGTEEDKHIFYTALYHTMIDPRMFEDVDGPGDFTKRTIFSGWDVFRSQMPLQTIINPQVVNDLIRSHMALAQTSGKPYFDRWEMLNAYSGCMVGNPTISVIADAYAKGIRGFDIKEAYHLCQNTAARFGNGDKGYSTGSASISETLEYAYGEWCLSQVALDAGDTANAAIYARAGQDYRNVFDKEKGWFRPRAADGSWMPWPARGRLQLSYGTVESNLYQQGWFVPHDIPGMVALMGGREKVIADLDTFMTRTPEKMLWNDYYNHANEPVHHVAFLFNRLGVPWLTQKWSREICRRAYHNSVEGLVGNEDVGQMSAWYVLAASGIHPVCPGSPRYEICSPVFERVSFRVGRPAAADDRGEPSATTFTIIAKNNSPENIYIQSATLNGRSYSKCWIDFSDIAAGGVLELTMGKTPNAAWGME